MTVGRLRSSSPQVELDFGHCALTLESFALGSAPSRGAIFFAKIKAVGGEGVRSLHFLWVKAPDPFIDAPGWNRTNIGGIEARCPIR